MRNTFLVPCRPIAKIGSSMGSGHATNSLRRSIAANATFQLCEGLQTERYTSPVTTSAPEAERRRTGGWANDRKETGKARPFLRHEATGGTIKIVECSNKITSAAVGGFVRGRFANSHARRIHFLLRFDFETHNNGEPPPYLRPIMASQLITAIKCTMTSSV